MVLPGVYPDYMVTIVRRGFGLKSDCISEIVGQDSEVTKVCAAVTILSTMLYVTEWKPSKKEKSTLSGTEITSTSPQPPSQTIKVCHLMLR